MSPYKRICCITSCKSRTTDDEKRRFFNFPVKNTKKYEEWLQACHFSYDHIINLKTPVICDLHFEERLVGKKKLFTHAVPTLKLGTDESDDGNEDDDDNELEVDINIENTDSYVHRPVASSSIDEPVDFVCKQCHTREQNVEYYRKKNSKLLQEVDRLKKVTKRLQIRYKNLAKKIYKSKRVFLKKNQQLKVFPFSSENINKAIDASSVSSGEAKTLCKMLLTRRKVYNEEEKYVSQALFFKSASLYNFMRDNFHFNLPSLRSIYNWLPLTGLSAGIQKIVFKKIEEATVSFTQEGREVALVYDEMTIKRNLEYNDKHDKVDGFVDYGDGEGMSQPNIGKNVCVFMIRSLCGNWKQVINYVVSEKCIPSHILQKLICENIKSCKEINLNVKALICDQCTVNQSLYKKLGVTAENPYFLFENEKVYCFFDVPHLFKSIRNNLLHYRLKAKEGGCANWEVLRQMYLKDSQFSTRICPRLKPEHIAPTVFERMNVRLAVQAISASAVAGIRTFIKLNLFTENLTEDAHYTAVIFEKLNQLFDCLNSKSALSSNPYNAALKHNNVPHKFLYEMKDYVAGLKFITISKRVKINCLTGLYQSINATLLISKEMFEKYDKWNYLCTNKLTQDCLENFFSHVRYKKRNPSVYEFSHIIARTFSVNLMYSSKSSNCEKDGDKLLEIDWQTITNFDKENSVIEDSNIYNQSELVNQDSKLDTTISQNFDSFEPHFSILPDNATRYFSGYVLHKLFKKKSLQNCDDCKMSCVNSKNIISAPNEWLLYFKNYKKTIDFGSLHDPTDNFFYICKMHVKIFENIFHLKSHEKGIMRNIIHECEKVSPDWFDCRHKCYEHRIQILKFFLLILIRKNCSWKIQSLKIHSEKTDRLKVLQQ